MERVSQRNVGSSNITTTDKVIFIIALLLMNVRVNLVGSMSLTEIFVVLRIPHLLHWVNTKGRTVPYLHKIYTAFILLVVAQCVAEFMVGNTLINAVKGIAVTVMALFLMLFYLEYLLKDIKLVVWIPVCGILGLLVFGDQFGFADEDGMTYFKFYIAPIVASLTTLVTLIGGRWFRRNMTVVLVCASLFVIAGGARSLGFSMLFSTMAMLIIKRQKKISFKKMLPGIITACIVIQCFLTFIYMPKVKSGEWGSDQNRSQFSAINWNSNIFMILFSARTDFFVGTQAFLDKPLWGHGSWAKDPTYKYAAMQAELQGEKYKPNLEEIGYVPTHSVVMSKGVSNGVFAFCIFLWIFITVYKVGFKGISSNSKYTYYQIWVVISSSQHLMFGPPAILKNSGSIAFATMLAFYFLNVRDKKLLLEDEQSQT